MDTWRKSTSGTTSWVAWSGSSWKEMASPGADEAIKEVLMPRYGLLPLSQGNNDVATSLLCAFLALRTR